MEFCIAVDREFVSNGEIDPHSLATCDDSLHQDNVSNEEENMNEESLEKSLTVLSSQQLAPMNDSINQLIRCNNRYLVKISIKIDG